MSYEQKTLKLNPNFDRKAFEIKYKEEINESIKKSIRHFLRQSEYFEKNYIFIVNNIVEIYINDLYNIKFLDIREKIYKLVDDLNIKVSFFDILLKEEILKSRLSFENKDLEEVSDRGEYKTKRLRTKIKLNKEREKRIKLRKQTEKRKEEDKIRLLKKKIKRINKELVEKKVRELKLKKYYKFLKKIGAKKENEFFYKTKEYCFYIKKMQAFHIESKKWFGLNSTIDRINQDLTNIKKVI